MTETHTRLDDLARLTRRYSAWGRGGDEGGLPLAWGGLTLMLLVTGWTLMGLAADTFAAGHPLSPSSAMAADSPTLRRWYGFLDQIRPLVMGLLPLAWILGKDAFRDRLYQSHGRVEPALPGHSKGIQFISRTVLILAGAIFPMAAMWLCGSRPSPQIPPMALNLGLTACWALPWLGWSRVRGTMETLLWMVMALLTLLWLWLPLTNTWLGPVVFLPSLLLGPVVFATGLVQHLRFRRLSRELRALEVP